MAYSTGSSLHHSLHCCSTCLLHSRSESIERIALVSRVLTEQQSPRWYLTKGRREDALSSLQKLRRGRFSEQEIHMELQELRAVLDLTVEKGRLIEIFYRSNLKRTLIAIGTNIFLQITGQNFVTTYGTVFIKTLGTVNPFTMTSVNTALFIVASICTMLLTDNTGRRFVTNPCMTEPR